MNRKALSPVVAISLLLVVTVVSVTGFLNWHVQYSSTKFTTIEDKSNNNINEIEILSVIDGIVYVKNTFKENYTYDRLMVGDNDCAINKNLTLGVNKIDIKNCISNILGSNEILIQTKDGIIQKQIYFSKEILTDINPDSFSYTDLFNQNSNTQIVSENVSVSGFTEPLSASISGDGTPQISINGGAWSASPSNVNLNDNISIRTLTGVSNTTFNIYLTLGDFTTTWIVQTKMFPTIGRTVDNLDGTWTTTLQPGPEGKDAGIGIADDHFNENTNYGSRTYSCVRQLGSTYIIKSFYEYNISTLPINTVTDANFNAYFYQVQGSWTTHNVVVRRITSPWDEMSVTGLTSPTIDTTNLATTAVTNNNWGFYSWDVTSLVQNWEDNTWDNYGFSLLTPINLGWQIGYFYSSDYTDDITRRPILNITYIPN